MSMGQSNACNGRGHVSAAETDWRPRLSVEIESRAQTRVAIGARKRWSLRLWRSQLGGGKASEGQSRASVLGAGKVWMV